MPQLARLPPDITEVMPCFIGFQLSEDSLAYLAPRMTHNYWLLKQRGWPVRRVLSEKWHVTILWFERLSRKERAILWSYVQAEVERGTWANMEFDWQGLAVWHNWSEPGLVALAAKKIRAVKEWGLQPWLTDPICSKGRLNRLKSYQPHITMIRFLEDQIGPPGCRDWEKEWEDIQPQLQPIDPARVHLDRVTLFLSDFSQRPHRYIYEHTMNIPKGKRRGLQLNSTLKGDAVVPGACGGRVADWRRPATAGAAALPPHWRVGGWNLGQWILC